MRAAALSLLVVVGCAGAGPGAGPDAGGGAADASPSSSRDSGAATGQDVGVSGPADGAVASTPDAAAALPDAAGAGPADSGTAVALDAAVQPPDASPQQPDAAVVDHCSETPVGKVSLPADDSVHEELMEWWYWTGHLKTADGRWFGFEQCYFLSQELVLTQRSVHVAITDIEGGAFHYDTHLELGGYTVVPDGFDFSIAPQTAKGGNGHDVLHAEADGWTLDLKLDAVKAPVLQHETGYTDYSFGGNTYYYSRERMAASGTLSDGTATYAVTGTGWFDHQWGNIAFALNKGWDWFALELEGPREMMLFIVRDSTRQILVGGSYTDENCVTKSIAGSALQVTPLGDWKSPRTGCTYPSGWSVLVEGKTYFVTPVIQDQEVSSAIPIYWEGACTVSGDATGRAYVELTGYCP